MKIFYVGNFNQSHCTEVHLANTLESLGHEVIRVQENSHTPDTLTNFINNNQFDLFLFTRTWGETVTLEHLALLRERKIPSVSYHLDLYIGLARKYSHHGKTLEEVFKTDAFWNTDFVFTPDGDPVSQTIFEANGIKHQYMKAGVYKPECIKAKRDLLDDYKHEVLFVGGGDKIGSPNIYVHSEWEYRNELVTWLYDTYGSRFTKFGHPQNTIRNEELNQLYTDTKVVVGDSVCIGFNHTDYWSDRVYETIGRGGFLIHPYIKGLEEEFTDGETIVFYEYGNFNQLKEKIDYYLTNDEAREKIRKAGFELVKNKCTYTERLSRMIDIVSTDERLLSQSSVASVPIDDTKPDEGMPTLSSSGLVAPIKINLGAGSEPTEGWTNIDLLPLTGIDIVHNLSEFPWPIDNEVADDIKAIDLLEHIDTDKTIMFVKECWRILQHGGKLFMTVPHWQSKNLWIDPTHKRGYDEKSMDYFDPETDFGKWYGYYSDCKFKVSSVRTPNDNVEFTMVKI